MAKKKNPNTKQGVKDLTDYKSLKSKGSAVNNRTKLEQLEENRKDRAVVPPRGLYQ